MLAKMKQYMHLKQYTSNQIIRMLNHKTNEIIDYLDKFDCEFTLLAMECLQIVEKALSNHKGQDIQFTDSDLEYIDMYLDTLEDIEYHLDKKTTNVIPSIFQLYSTTDFAEFIFNKTNQ